MFQLTSVAPMLQNKYINDLVEKEKKNRCSSIAIELDKARDVGRQRKKKKGKKGA